MNKSAIRRKQWKRAVIWAMLLSMLFTLVPYAAPERAQAAEEAYGGAAVHAGSGRTYVIKPDGTLWGKGASLIGDNTTSNRTEFVQILPDEGPFVEVSNVLSHTLALSADGRVWAWGTNQQGEIGNGQTTNQLPAQPVPYQVIFPAEVVIKQVSATRNYSLALSDDGRLWEWGLSPQYTIAQANEYRHTTPSLVRDETGEPITGIRSISGSDGAVFAITYDGEMWTWGDNNSLHLKLGLETVGRYGPTKLAFRQAEQVSSGHNHTVVLRGDGTVWGWGKNNNGELGTAVEIGGITYLPVQIEGLENIVSIHAGYNGTLALDDQGNLWALGSAKFIGVQGETSNEPVIVGGDVGRDVILYSATSRGTTDHLLVVNRDGALWAWGHNNSRQVIDTAENAIHTPTRLAFFDSLAGDTPMRYTRLEPFRGQTGVALEQAIRITFDRDIAAGDNVEGIMIEDAEGRPVDGIAATVTDYVLTIAHDAFATDTAYTVVVPNDAVRDQNGRANEEIRWSFETVSTVVPEVAGMAPADGGEMAPDGAIHVFFTMQVEAGPSIADVTLVDAAGQPADHVRAVVEGNRLSILHDPLQEHAEYTATIPANAVHNSYGNGNPPLQWTFATGANSSLPPVEPDAVIAAGNDRVIIGEKDGMVWAWGSNSNGRLGSGTSIVLQHAPVPVRGLTDVIDVVAGSNHSAALKQDGTVWTWGTQNAGALGNGTMNEPNRSPVQVDGLSEIRHIASGSSHLVALREDGTVWAWGQGGSGQLGNGATANSPIPVQVSELNGITAVASGSTHSLAIGEGGVVWAWGSNNYGQLGDGTILNSSVPVRAGELSHVTAIAAGNGYSLALRQDGTVWAWGSNSAGQLGTDPADLAYSPLPVEIMGLADVRTLIGGNASAFAILDDGSLWGWGSGQNGVLGIGSTEERTEPVRIIEGVTAAAAGRSSQGFVIALTDEGSVMGWGYNGPITSVSGHRMLRDEEEQVYLEPVMTMYGRIGADQAPVVIEANPDEGQQEVAINDRLVLTFNEDVQLSPSRSLEEISFADTRIDSPQVGNMLVNHDGRTLTIDHDPLQVRMFYRVTIPYGLFVDEAGNPNREISYLFRTIQGDMEPPVPIVLTPDNGEQHVPLDQPIEVRFDEPIFPGSRVADVELVDEFGSKRGVTTLVSDNRLVIAHDGLNYSTDYTVNVPGGAVADELGNVNAAFSWEFRTRGESGDEVEIHFINVGQGDGIYIKLPDNIDVVIDSGHWNDPFTVANYLQSQNVDDIEYLIATHMDADHIGGMANILNRFTVENIIDNGGRTSTQTFSAYESARMNEIQNEGANYHRIQSRGDLQTFQLTDQVRLQLLAPVQQRGGSNDNSIVALLDTGEIQVMLTGDAVEAQEMDILAYASDERIDLSAEVLKVAHHGSASSTSQRFLQAVQPMSAVISVGSNSYGHPTSILLDRLSAAGATVYRTDRDSVGGAIVMVTDGASYRINDEWIVPPEHMEPVTARPLAERISLTDTGSRTFALAGDVGAVFGGAVVRVYEDALDITPVAETTAASDGSFEIVFELEESRDRVHVTAQEAGKAESAAAIILLTDQGGGKTEARATVTLDLPGGTYVEPGDPFRVQVRMDDYAGIYGAQIQLRYDPDMLELVDDDPTRDGLQIALGDVFADVDHVEVMNSVVEAEGLVTFAAMLLGEPQGISGDTGTLADLQFMALPNADVDTVIELLADGTKFAAYPAGDPPSWQVEPTLGLPVTVSIQGGEYGDTVVYLEANQQRIGQQDTVTVSVMIDEYQQLSGVQLRLDYDPTMLRLVDQDPDAEGVQARNGTIFTGRQAERLLNTADETIGRAAYADVLLGAEEVSGRIPRSVAEWVFEPIGSAGEAAIGLSAEHVKLAGSPGVDGMPVKLPFLADESPVMIEIGGGTEEDTEPPTWPAGARLEAGEVTSTSIGLRWPQATDNEGVAAYVLEYDDNILTVRDTVYRVTGLQPGTSYTFTVRAIDEAGNESEALILSVSTLSGGSSGGGGTGGGTGGAPSTPGTGSDRQESDRWQPVAEGLRLRPEAIHTRSDTHNGLAITVLSLDEAVWSEGFAELAGQRAGERRMVITAEGDASAVMLELPFAVLRQGLEQAPGVTVALQLGTVTYELPLDLYDGSSMFESGNVADHASLYVVVRVLEGEDRQAVVQQAVDAGVTLISDVAVFDIFAEVDGNRMDLNSFEGRMVKRIFQLSGGVDSATSTGVLIDNGTFIFVPATFERRGSSVNAVLMSDHNSAYAVIEHRKTFSDVAQHWAKTDIELLAAKLVVQGVNDTEYAPERNITRAELTALLVRALGIRGEAASAIFSDVPLSAWYADEVYSAAQAGLLTGYPDGTFRPEQTITREETAVLLSRAIAYAGAADGLSPNAGRLAAFTDQNRIGDWAREELSVAVQSGLVQGTPDGSFRPEQQATRAEAAVMLKRLLQYVGYIDHE